MKHRETGRRGASPGADEMQFLQAELHKWVTCLIGIHAGTVEFCMCPVNYAVMLASSIAQTIDRDNGELDASFVDFTEEWCDGDMAASRKALDKLKRLLVASLHCDEAAFQLYKLQKLRDEFLEALMRGTMLSLSGLHIRSKP